MVSQIRHSLVRLAGRRSDVTGERRVGHRTSASLSSGSPLS